MHRVEEDRIVVIAIHHLHLHRNHGGEGGAAGVPDGVPMCSKIIYSELWDYIQY